MGSTFSLKISLSPAFRQGDQNPAFCCCNFWGTPFALRKWPFRPIHSQKLISGMHFLRENEASRENGSDSTTLCCDNWPPARKNGVSFSRNELPLGAVPSKLAPRGLPSTKSKKKKKQSTKKKTKNNKERSQGVGRPPEIPRGPPNP